ncbi:MAG TPA: TetR/AcrR family transcriptional regulator [Planctomycetota bacterium]|nr:TetR/AcrR family transcriptional regulator [Planctomycetota bacterium]
MRVTPETRERTRRDLLQAGTELFAEVGFGAATTRELARRAQVGVGTLFNYFASKEALAAAVLERSLRDAWDEREAEQRSDESAEEALFALVAAELRHLTPHRAWVAEVVESGLSPLRRGADEGVAALRSAHLERVQDALRQAGLAAPGEVSLHLYWTLYLGVLSFWSHDASEHDAATLALLDRSIQLFCRALREDEPTEV